MTVTFDETEIPMGTFLSMPIDQEAKIRYVLMGLPDPLRRQFVVLCAEEAVSIQTRTPPVPDPTVWGIEAGPGLPKRELSMVEREALDMIRLLAVAKPDIGGLDVIRKTLDGQYGRLFQNTFRAVLCNALDVSARKAAIGAGGALVGLSIRASMDEMLNAPKSIYNSPIPAQNCQNKSLACGSCQHFYCNKVRPPILGSLHIGDSNTIKAQGLREASSIYIRDKQIGFLRGIVIEAT